MAELFEDAHAVPRPQADGNERPREGEREQAQPGFGTAAGERRDGTDGDDALVGGEGEDTLDGLAGNDAALGLAGADSVLGGDGDDLVAGGPGDDVLYGDGTFGPFPRIAPPEPLALGNLVLGGSGDDTVYAGFGADTVFGGAGDDTITGAGAGAPGGNPADTFDALDGADLLFGGAGADSIEGNGGADTIFGGAGGDRVSGGRGADLLAGGAGPDVFVWDLIGRFLSETGTGVGEGARDVVADFRKGEDLLDLSGLTSRVQPRPPEEPEPVFLGTDPFTAERGFQVRYDILEGGRTVVQFADVGTAVPERPGGEIELRGSYALALGDFVL